MVKTSHCQAKNPATCRYHGNQLAAKYDTHLESYKKTGALPKILFTGETVHPKIDTAKLLEYGFYLDSNIQSFGFSRAEGEDVDWTAYVEIPVYESEEEEIAAVTKMRDEETNPVMKARYDTILKAVSQENADIKLIEMEKETNKRSEELIRASDYETSVADAEVIYQYGKAVDQRDDLDPAEKAILLWESLKKHHDMGTIDLGSFGEQSYKDVVEDTWNVFALVGEQRERQAAP